MSVNLRVFDDYVEMTGCIVETEVLKQIDEDIDNLRKRLENLESDAQDFGLEGRRKFEGPLISEWARHAPYAIKRWCADLNLITGICLGTIEEIDEKIAKYESARDVIDDEDMQEEFDEKIELGEKIKDELECILWDAEALQPDDDDELDE